jgi:hypothetical protein
MLDPNNQPGGSNLILTAKSADKVQFFDAQALALTGEIAMPGSTHEAAAPSGRTRTRTAASRSSISRPNRFGAPSTSAVMSRPIR